MRPLLVVVALGVIAGCGRADDTGERATTVAPVPATSGAKEPVPTTTPSTAKAGTPVDPTMSLVTGAVSDLAARLGIAPGAVTVVTAEAVTWGDTSLGCPQPGQRYLQVITDGLLVVLEAEGRRYEYHGGDPLVLCEQPQKS